MHFLRQLFSLCFLFLLPAASFGGTIKGRVLNTENKPVEFAIVTLLNAPDSVLIKGAITAEDGSFSFSAPDSGSFIISATLTGFEKKWMPAFSISGSAEYVVPDIVMQPSQQLQEITVMAAQPLFVRKPDMLVMNVENSPVRITGTAYDVVSKAPGVSTDPDGNFSLQGRFGVRIYVDGKNTFLNGEQLRNYLQSIPASDVVRVEIMTNPPAKYDAEGSAGVINIVTRKGSHQGFNCSVNGGLGYGRTWKTEAGLSCNYGTRKMNLYAKYDYGTPWRGETKFVTRTVAFEGITTRYDQNVELMIKPVTQHVRLGADFYPRENISWGIRLDGTSFRSNTDVDTWNTQTPDSGGVSVLHQENLLHGNFNNGSVGVYYQQQFDTLGTELSGGVDFLEYDNNSNENYALRFYDINQTETVPPLFERTNKSTGVGIIVGRVDFTHPFAKKYKLSCGLKSSYVKTSSDLLFEALDPSVNDWFSDTTKSNSFVYTEQINAAYTSLDADFGKWQLQTGLRLEQTISDGYSPTTGEDHKNNYLQLFPTVFATRKINDKHSLTFAMSRRINRPVYSELNPFIFYVDQYTYHIGNPFLQPEISNSLEITHDYADVLFTTLGVSRTTGGMAQLTQQIDSTGILHQSEVNLNTIDNAYLDMTLSLPVTKWWTNECDFVVSYDRYRSDLYGTPFDRGNFVFTGTINETFLVKGGWKFELSSFYQTRTVYTIFVLEPSADVTVGISKNFMKNTLRCSLNMGDIFYWQTQHVRVDFANQHLYAWHEFDTRVLFLRVRYSFGSGKTLHKSQFNSGADELKKRAG